MIHTPEQQKTMLAGMRAAAKDFYVAAALTQCHAFVEFAGLMNEYIKICARALEQGKDFTETNIHTGEALTIEAYEAAYLREKLECIFGTSLNIQLGLVHILDRGAPLCRFEPGVPITWPDGHSWVGLGQPGASCASCLAVAREGAP